MIEKRKGFIKESVLFFLLIMLFSIDVNAEGNIQDGNLENQIKKTVQTSVTVLSVDNLSGEKAEENISFQDEEVLRVEQQSDKEYRITLSNVMLSEGVKSVSIPIWSKVNGQDDIKWYNAQKQSDGSYMVIMNLMNHKGLGEYYVHAYAVTDDGKYSYLAATTFLVNEPEIDSISVVDSDMDNGSFRVMITGITNGDMIKQILVPVWSMVNGQDDIRWYEAKKNSFGEYYVDVNIKNHKYSMGKYNIHVYSTDITGYQYYIGYTQQEITMEKGSLTITKDNEKDYTIWLADVHVPGGISQILFPVWSKVNGQDDIRWYIATRVSSGSYECKIPLTNHKGLGEFLVHAYAKMPDGTLIYLGNEVFETEVPSVGNIEADITNKENGQFQVKISNVKNDELIKTIQVPVWSASNQDDIIWYSAEKNINGEYVVNVNIANHKYNCSKYNIHIYITDITGCLQYKGATTCDLCPEYEDFLVDDISGTESSYKATMTGLKVPAGAKNVQFAVWGDLNGQNDIKWYTVTGKSDGSYSYNINIRNHKELGTYYVHAYCTTRGNTLKYLGAANFVVMTKPTIAQVQVSDINGTSGTFKVTVSGVKALSGVDNVQIPVWCSGDQSDIVWYTATKLTEGVYTTTVKVSNHWHHFGNYKVHVYVSMGNGVTAFTGSTTATIQALNYIYSTPISSTQREVGIMGATTATRVQFPSWSNANGQDDVVWYEGTNRGNSNWNAVVDTVKHISGGTYTTHVYITINGQSNYGGALSYSLNKIATAQSLMMMKANLYSSSTGFLVLVNRSTHKVGVFQGWQGNWNCIQYWDCSDGAPSTPTVEGVFRVGSRGYYFDSGASRCYWYTQFYGNYLFHSVLYNKNGTLQDGRLGMALSHGCVRLNINNAKWIYDTIPSGTTVVVYH